MKKNREKNTRVEKKRIIWRDFKPFMRKNANAVNCYKRWKKPYFSTKILQKQSAEVFYKKGVLAVPDTCNFIKKKTQAQVFSCEFCEIF